MTTYSMACVHKRIRPPPGYYQVLADMSSELTTVPDDKQGTLVVGIGEELGEGVYRVERVIAERKKQVTSFS